MDRTRVLMGNEPTAYREALTLVLQSLRPEVDVLAVDPGDLESAMERFDPHLVISSRPLATAAPSLLASLLLYPQGVNRVEADVGGEFVIASDIEVEGVLAIVDQTGQLARVP